jgi:Mat/Ecp fimbriae major subunit
MTDRRDIMLTKSIGRSLGLAGAVVALGLVSQPAGASNQATGHASAVILQAINLVENTAMNFGDIFQTGGAGTVTLTPANAISGAGFNFFGATSAGQFTATGTAGAPAVITFSTGDTLSNGAQTIPIGTYTTDAGASPVFPGASGPGNLVFHVGATLTIAATQAAGSYIGTYTVTVNY